MSTHIITADRNLGPRLTTLTQQGKIPWRIVTNQREKNWELADACNIIAGHRNGVDIRFCQGRRGDYFLHLLNDVDVPVRLTLPKAEAETLVQEIAKTIPALKRVFDALDWWTTHTEPKPKATWWQKFLPRLPFLA